MPARVNKNIILTPKMALFFYMCKFDQLRFTKMQCKIPIDNGRYLNYL